MKIETILLKHKRFFQFRRYLFHFRIETPFFIL